MRWNIKSVFSNWAKSCSFFATIS